jgi:hypothetical protein
MRAMSKSGTRQPYTRASTTNATTVATSCAAVFAATAPQVP